MHEDVNVNKLLCDMPEKLVKIFSTSLFKYSAILIYNDLGEAVDFVNDYAPEHLQLTVRNHLEVMEKLNNVGAILLGECTMISSADYFGGYKRYFQPMQIENLLIGHFIVYIDNAMHLTENREAFKQLREPVIRLFTSIFRRILMGHSLVDLVCKNARNPYLNIEKKLFVIEVAM